MSINSTNIPPIMIINRIYEHQNLLSLKLVSFLVGLRTYQHPCIFQWEKLEFKPGCSFTLAKQEATRTFKKTKELETEYNVTVTVDQFSNHTVQFITDMR
jgi:hypothetical protein